MRSSHILDTKLNTSECPQPVYTAWFAFAGIQMGTTA